MSVSLILLSPVIHQTFPEIGYVLFRRQEKKLCPALILVLAQIKSSGFTELTMCERLYASYHSRSKNAFSEFTQL